VGVRELVREAWSGRKFDDGVDSWDGLSECAWKCSGMDMFRRTNSLLNL